MAKEKVYVKNLGLNISPPSKVCNDRKCPWHGEVRVRGRILRGIVVSDKMDKTVTVVIPRIVRVPKYERYMKKRTKIKAHNPPCINARIGDIVIIGETRKLAKTKAFVVLAVVGRAHPSVLVKLGKKVPPHYLEKREEEEKEETEPSEKKENESS